MYHLLPTSCTIRGHDKILGIREIIARFEFLSATKSSGLLCLSTCSYHLLKDCCTFALNNKHSYSTSTKHLSADTT